MCGGKDEDLELAHRRCLCLGFDRFGRYLAVALLGPIGFLLLGGGRKERKFVGNLYQYKIKGLVNGAWNEQILL